MVPQERHCTREYQAVFDLLNSSSLEDFSTKQVYLKSNLVPNVLDFYHYFNTHLKENTCCSAKRKLVELNTYVTVFFFSLQNTV